MSREDRYRMTADLLARIDQVTTGHELQHSNEHGMQVAPVDLRSVCGLTEEERAVIESVRHGIDQLATHIEQVGAAAVDAARALQDFEEVAHAEPTS